MIRNKGGTQSRDCATCALVDEMGHEVEVIAEIEDCSCRDGHVNLRLAEMNREKEKHEEP